MLSKITVENSLKIKQKFFKTYYRRVRPLTIPDEVILGLLHENGGSMLFKRLGTLLGFAVSHKPEENVFKDQAEVDLFQSFLQKLSNFHLIEKKRNIVKVTYWGEKAFARGEKYTFHTGIIDVFSFSELEVQSKGKDYPFHKLGINTNLTRSREIVPSDIYKSDKSEKEKLLENSFLINYQEDSESIILDKIECDSFVDIDEIAVPVNVRLQISKQEKSLSVLNGDKRLDELTKLLHLEENKEVYSRFENYAKYKLYLRESNELSINKLLRFGDNVEWLDLLSDKRIIWNESSIEALANASLLTGDEWKKISANCEVQVILNSLNKFKDWWDWPIISQRLPEKYILENLRTFPWDEDILSERFQGNYLERFLLEREYENVFDWDQVIQKLDNEFIYNNFEQLNINASYLSVKNHEIAKFLIPEYPEKEWDWSYITANYDLEYISRNTDTLLAYLDPVILLKRNFKEGNKKSLSNSDIKKVIGKIQAEEPTFKVSYNTDINLKGINLDILENSGLLFWGTRNTPGVEANENLVWTDGLFEKYGNRIQSNEGLSHVSKTISPKKVIDYEFFNWDYEILSERDEFINVFSTLKKIYPKLNLEKVLSKSSSILVNNLSFLLARIRDDEEEQVLTDVLSEKVKPYELVSLIRQYQLYSFKFEWSTVLDSISSKRLEKIILDYQNTLNSIVNSKSFWSTASKQVDLEFILENLPMRWDWEFLTKNEIAQKDLQNSEFRSQYSEYIYWPYIISEVLPDSDLAKTSVLDSIANNLRKTSDEIVVDSWTALTQSLPYHVLWKKINQTTDDDLFKWDWHFISSSGKISLEKDTLEKYADKLNWNYLSSNEVLKTYFNDGNENLYDSVDDWYNQVYDYLTSFEQYWDFKELSNISNITWYEKLVDKFRDKWDWEVLSSEECRLLKAGDNLILRRLSKFKSKIHWGTLSAREDIKLSQNIVQRFSKEAWDWKALSKNSEFSFDEEFLIEYREKEWDWRSLSERKCISNKSLSELPNIGWNWITISNRDDLIFDNQLLSILDEKDEVVWKEIPYRSKLEITLETLRILDSNGALDENAWNQLSGHKNLKCSKNLKLLKFYRDKWNWEKLVRSDKVDVNSFSLLQEYEAELNWEQVSSHRKFDPTKKTLSKFKKKIDWNAITKTVDITNSILNQFKEYVNWSIVSKSKKIDFSTHLIQKYEDYWDWHELEKNPVLSKECKYLVNDKVSSTPELRFYFKIKDQPSDWAGYVYHFTHLTNALDIIRSKKILSRNKANGSDFADAAGNVVGRRSTSHDFARFYFRPQTPTQFYNESLGKDHTDDNYFDRARALGLPKCPIPVFFKFDLQEIVLKYPDKCYISDGNMQTNWADFGPIDKMMSRFKYKDLFSTVKSTDIKTYLDCSQQEFLVRGELNISEIKNFEVFVQSEEDKNQLERLINQDSIGNRISVDGYESVYHGENKNVQYSYEDGVFEISSDYRGDGFRSGSFIAEFEDDSAFEIISGSINSKDGNKIYAYPNLKLSVKENESFRVLFHDDIKNVDWEVFRTSSTNKTIKEESLNLENSFKSDSPHEILDDLIGVDPELGQIYKTKVRHYTLYDHTSLVLKCFDQYFSSHRLSVDTSLFRTFLALHDIGKPIAFDQGNKSNQHKHTQRIIKSIWDKLPYSEKDLSLMLALSSGDHLGSYFQGRQVFSRVKNAIKKLASRTEIDARDLLYLYMVYYECDIASYTADEGGIKFLEHLFEYHNGTKVFNDKERLIQLKPKIWSKYQNLKSSLR